MSTAVIVGSAFERTSIEALGASPELIQTRFGAFELWRLERGGWIAPRHGLPHTTLPHQIAWRAMAQAIKDVGATQVMVTSSVGVLDGALPIMEPLLVDDVIMLENRLPDGSPCTMFLERDAQQGHLVLEQGLLNQELMAQLRAIAQRVGWPIAAEATFGYVAGPRTKTRAENRLWATLGAQVNSMTLAPELVLLNELELPCVALVVGHKYSLPQGAPSLKGAAQVTRSLEDSQRALKALVVAALEELEPVAFANHLYRFAHERR